jgi:Uma2 family endonuclease
MSAITPVLPPIPAPEPGWIPSRLHRITIDEYEEMVRSGALRSRKRLHLINGYLVEKMTQDPPHRVADELCGAALARIVPADRYHVPGAKPVRLPLPGRDSEPEPDRCVVRGAIRDYERHHPGPGDIALIVEVADSSLADDHKLATEVYGPAGIPVYWIVNLVHRQVEVYTDPGPAGYRSSEVFPEGQSVPVVIDGEPLGWIAVAEVLPSRPAAPAAGA